MIVQTIDVGNRIAINYTEAHKDLIAGKFVAYIPDKTELLVVIKVDFKLYFHVYIRNFEIYCDIGFNRHYIEFSTPIPSKEEYDKFTKPDVIINNVLGLIMNRIKCNKLRGKIKEDGIEVKICRNIITVTELNRKSITVNENLKILHHEDIGVSKV
jgi:hypothetical protein